MKLPIVISIRLHQSSDINVLFGVSGSILIRWVALTWWISAALIAVGIYRWI